MLCRLLIPCDRLCIILRDAERFCIYDAQIGLRIGIALRCRRLIQSDRFFRVL